VDGVLAAPMIVVHDAAGLGEHEQTPVKVRELRCMTVGRTPMSWPAYPSFVREVSDWIAGAASAHPDATMLLGMRGVPQEIGIGLGIDAATGSPETWPRELWPLHWDPHRVALVIPRLDLGSGRLSDPGVGVLSSVSPGKQ
jgi:hypothetical protein